MAYTAYPHSSPYYRPKKLPRVLRRHAPVLLLGGTIMFIGLVAMAVTWRNLTYERLLWDVGHNRATTESLNKEIQHLSSQIEVESAYPRLAKWAKAKHGWSVVQDRNRVFVVPQSALTPKALGEARTQAISDHD